MSQYVFTMTSRMVAIAFTCALLLCLLLFLLGIQVGKLWGLEQALTATPAASVPPIPASPPPSHAQPTDAPAIP